MMYGYIIERQGVTWNERFYKSGFVTNDVSFGNDDSARIFLSREDAENMRDKILKEEGLYTVVHARLDFYPSGN